MLQICYRSSVACQDNTRIARVIGNTKAPFEGLLYLGENKAPSLTGSGAFNLTKHGSYKQISIVFLAFFAAV